MPQHLLEGSFIKVVINLVEDMLSHITNGQVRVLPNLFTLIRTVERVLDIPHHTHHIELLSNLPVTVRMGSSPLHNSYIRSALQCMQH